MKQKPTKTVWVIIHNGMLWNSVMYATAEAAECFMRCELRRVRVGKLADYKFVPVKIPGVKP